MKTRRVLSMALALILVFAFVPVVSLAENMGDLAYEAEQMRKLDNVWADLDAAEAAAINAGESRNEVINAVYAAALSNGLVDKDGFSDFTKDGFFFTVDGMYCAYNYRLQNEIDNTAAPIPEDQQLVTIKGNGNGTQLKDAESPNVLLVAPYYGHDSSFTDQYKREAQSIADVTGGDYTLIQSTAATGPAIVENYIDRGVVIYDSHGTASGTSSYLCLTTKEGITQEDFSNGWAVNAGSAAYIDGRYVQNHVADTLSNCIVWMAICEGMKLSGRGTTGTALLEAGAGIVYGYSQSVTFVGDYKYEETFWNSMKEGGTVAEAYQAMTDRWGFPEPHGDAYPIVMSDVDAFPANPDAPQTVYCEWTLFGNTEPVALESFTLDVNSAEMYVGRTANVSFGRVPDNANAYELVWTSANENIATVNGNNRRATITGVNPGTTTVTCTVMVDGNVFGTANVAVTVNVDTTLFESLNVAGGSINFGTSESYPFIAEEGEGRYYAKSGNGGVNSSSSSITATVNMNAGETLTFDYKYGSENNYDWFNFEVNGTQKIHVSGTSNTGWQTYTYTATATGAVTFVWSFTKDSSQSSGIDCVMIDEVAYSGGTSLLGDVDGDGSVSINDAILVQRHALGINLLSEDALEVADFDGDGSVSTSDAVLIARAAMGL